MTISLDQHKKLLGYTTPAGHEEYVVPQAGVELDPKADWFKHFKTTLGANAGVTGMTFRKDDNGMPSVLLIGNKATFDTVFAGPATGAAEVTNVTIVAASIAGGDYWLHNSPGNSYYVWYKYVTAGYQEVDFTVVKAGGDATGLANDTTAYTVTVVVDGVSKAISVVGSTAQTFTNLLNEINTDLAGSATAAIVGGNIRITSATTGASSKVSIAPTTDTLFDVLTNFLARLSPVSGGVDGVDPIVSGRVGVAVELLSTDTNDLVADKTAAALDALVDVSCPNPVANIIAVTNTVAGAVTNDTDVNAGVTPAVTTPGTLVAGYIAV